MPPEQSLQPNLPSREELNQIPDLSSEDTAALIDAANRVQELQRREEQGELSPDIMQSNQEVYKFLGLTYDDGRTIDLQEELKQGNIQNIPSPEQKERAEQEGYTLGILTPEGLRDEIQKQFKSKFASIFSSQGFYDYTNGQDINQTEHFKNDNQKTGKFFFAMIKLDKETKDIQPKTTDLTFPEIEEILQKHNQDPANRDFQLQGLTIEQYLLFITRYYLDHQQEIQNEIKSRSQQGIAQDKMKITTMPDTESWCFLLKEIIESSDPEKRRCLSADWYPGGRRVNVLSNDVSHRDPEYGARFAAVA